LFFYIIFYHFYNLVQDRQTIIEPINDDKDLGAGDDNFDDNDNFDDDNFDDNDNFHDDNFDNNDNFDDNDNFDEANFDDNDNFDENDDSMGNLPVIPGTYNNNNSFTIFKTIFFRCILTVVVIIVKLCNPKSVQTQQLLLPKKSTTENSQ